MLLPKDSWVGGFCACSTLQTTKASKELESMNTQGSLKKTAEHVQVTALQKWHSNQDKLSLKIDAPELGHEKMSEGMGTTHLDHRACLLGWDRGCPGVWSNAKMAQVSLFTSWSRAIRSPVGVQIKPPYLTDGIQRHCPVPHNCSWGGEANPWVRPTVSEWRQGDVPAGPRMDWLGRLLIL